MSVMKKVGMMKKMRVMKKREQGEKK